MATTAPTHLAGNFWWLQFRGGPVWRLIAIPLTGVLLLTVAAFSDSTWSAAALAFGAVFMFAVTLFPEAEALRAYGFNSARSLRVLALPALLSAAIPVAVMLVAHPNSRGLLSAGAAVVAGALWLAMSMPGEGVENRGGKAGALRAGRFGFEVFWRRNLYYAVGCGLVTGLLFPLSGHIGSDFLRPLLVSFPVLVLWMRMAGTEDLRPTTARAYGLTRKAWAGAIAGVSFVANAVFLAVAALGLALFDASLHTFASVALTALLGFTGCLAGQALRTVFEPVAFMVPWFFWIPLRYIMDVVHPEGLDRGMVIAACVQIGIALAVTLLVLALYLPGKVNARVQGSLTGEVKT